MTARHFSLADRLINEVDTALRSVAATPQAVRQSPGDGDVQGLDDQARSLSAALMRVNHSGEIAAQALYRGQALVSRSDAMRAELLAAADDEHDHLAWCDARTAQLGGKTSLLAPLWYAGSFAIGMAAGLAGDRTSLGFLAETERQVAEHLDTHLQRLPANDRDSRAIVGQMRDDEIQHGDRATELGGGRLPKPVRQMMRLLAKVMTNTAFRV